MGAVNKKQCDCCERYLGFAAEIGLTELINLKINGVYKQGNVMGSYSY